MDELPVEVVFKLLILLPPLPDVETPVLSAVFFGTNVIIFFSFLKVTDIQSHWQEFLLCSE